MGASAARAGRRERILVYYDGLCLYCRAAAGSIRRLDWLRRVALRSFRDDASHRRYGISDAAAAESMHAVLLGNAGPVVVAGFAAVMAVMRHLPLTWPLLPAAWVLQRVGLGERAYRWLADHRIFVADGEDCAEGSCRVHGAQKSGEGPGEGRP